ncbi:MAG: hypothetical protein WBD50_04950 [Candidatus Rhabdochlamydia sp.]
MAVQLLHYANVYSPRRYDENDILDLNLLNCNDQPNAIEQIDIEAERELAEIEAETQRRRAAVENRRSSRITRVNLLRENAIFIQTGSHKNIYPPPEEFIALIERQVGVISFIKDPEISGPAVKTAFSVITVASYAYIVPRMKEKGIQWIENYLRQIPVIGSTLSNSLSRGLSIINLPNTIAQWAWDPTKYLEQDYEMGDEYSPNIPLFNEDGTPKMVETSQREKTKFAGKIVAIGIALKYGPSLVTRLIDTINELRATHLLNQDWARTFFSSYFEWKVRKLREIEVQYNTPDVFQNDSVLNQPKYRCAQSGQFLIIPFKTPSNRVFQYSVIEDWLLYHHTCPVTEENLQANQLSFDAKIYDEMRYRLQAINR